LVLLAFAFGTIFRQRAEAQPRMANCVFGNGGAVITDNGFQLASTIGQSAIGLKHTISLVPSQ